MRRLCSATGGAPYSDVPHNGSRSVLFGAYDVVIRCAIGVGFPYGIFVFPADSIWKSSDLGPPRFSLWWSGFPQVQRLGDGRNKLVRFWCVVGFEGCCDRQLKRCYFLGVSNSGSSGACVGGLR